MTARGRKDRQMFCTKCGAEVKDGAVFCTKCGARIKAEPGGEKSQEGGGETTKLPPAQAVPVKTEKKGRGKLPLLLGAAAVLALAGAAVFFYGKKGAEKQPEPGTWEWDKEFDGGTSADGAEGNAETVSKEPETTAAGESMGAAKDGSSETDGAAQPLSGQAADDSGSSTANGAETAAAPDGMAESGAVPLDAEVFPPIAMDCVRSVSASSVLTEQSGAVHAAAQIMDQKLDRAWVEGGDGQGIGESVSFYFDGEYMVSGFTIHAGYQKSRDLYYKNSRPASVRIEFDGKNFLRFTLDDVCAAQTITFDTQQTASTVTLYIESVYAGEKYEDTVISELAFY